MKLIQMTMVRPERTRYGKKDATPALINADFIRCFYGRWDETGTRLTFADGDGFAVLEAPWQVIDYLRNAYGDSYPIVRLTQVRPGKRNSFSPHGQKSAAPVYIMAPFIRSFNARDKHPGTRLTFVNGKGFAVTETPEQVFQALDEAYRGTA